MRRSFPIAFFGSILGAVSLLIFDCQTGTYEQCLINKAMFWVYLPALFIVIWIVAALTLTALKHSGAEAEEKDDAGK
jgi:uncharacterized PurR-regulated membrane protein YhhQ (DUF165 family)